MTKANERHTEICGILLDIQIVLRRILLRLGDDVVGGEYPLASNMASMPTHAPLEENPNQPTVKPRE